EFGCSAEAYFDLQLALVQLTELRGQGIVLARASELKAFLAENEGYPNEDVSALIHRLTLARRPSWPAPPQGFGRRDLDLSRFDERLPLINRPLLALTDDDDTELLVAPLIVSDASMYAVSGLRDGSLQNQFWESNEARDYAGRQGDRAGEAF